MCFQGQKNDIYSTFTALSLSRLAAFIFLRHILRVSSDDPVCALREKETKETNISA